LIVPAPKQSPERLSAPFTSPEWVYELKFDGYRCMAGIEADDGFRPDNDEERYHHIAARVRVQTMSGADIDGFALDFTHKPQVLLPRW
jgi:bifunctional non-homologous end joining protein LigD